jgi:hypothetical protein
MKTYTGRLTILKRGLTSALIPLLFGATLAFAKPVGATGSGGLSPLTMIFLGFLAAIILLQLVPALILFSSMVVAVFKRSTKKTAATESEQT